MNRRASETGATPGERGSTGGMMEEQAGRAREAAQQAAGAGKERLQAGAGQAAEKVDHLAEAVGSAGSRLSEMDQEGLAEHANRLASWLGEMAEKLRSRSVDEIGDEIRRVAERNPALFVLGSVAVGVGLARFAKASRPGPGAWNGAAGEAGWTGGEAPVEPAASDIGRTGGYDSPLSTYEGGERDVFEESSERRPGERPIPPDSSGGTGL
ncbi:MAG TPA: hypothetical protein VKZ85_04365 [Woeseiaceae bacterium]|nr:hypothetical protein [Woeseiaceae bacterium]